MDPEQMARRCPNAVQVHVAMLQEHRLAFTRFSSNRGCGVADVLPDPSAEVWGVVYAVPNSELPELDAAEGYRRAADTGAYLWRQKHVLIDGDANRRLDVYTYVVATPVFPRPAPSRSYLAQILKGARHWNLPSGYCARLSETCTCD